MAAIRLTRSRDHISVLNRFIVMRAGGLSDGLFCLLHGFLRLVCCSFLHLGVLRLYSFKLLLIFRLLLGDHGLQGGNVLQGEGVGEQAQKYHDAQCNGEETFGLHVS